MQTITMLLTLLRLVPGMFFLVVTCCGSAPNHCPAQPVRTTCPISMAAPEASAPTVCLDGTYGEIYLFEGGIAVDETANYSYSDPHLISITTLAVAGYGSSEGVVPVTDENDTIVAYRLDLLDDEDNLIGYILYPNTPPQ